MLENLSWIADPAVAPAAAVVFGALVGSFLNVVILRLPPRLEHAWRAEARSILELDAEPHHAPAGLVVERSCCPKCGHRIRWWENIPVLSFVLLRGRCAGCKTAISWQYPFVEALTALLFLACVWRFGPTAQALWAMAFTALLVASAGIDARTQLLPDDLTYALLWLGLLASLTTQFVSPDQAIIGAIVGYLSLWSVFKAYLLLTGKEGMGYGDFKLLAALGAWLGWQPLLLVVILASVSGALIGGGIMIIRGRDHQLPFAFGPYLAVGGWVALIGGTWLIDGYLSLFRH